MSRWCLSGAAAPLMGYGGPLGLAGGYFREPPGVSGGLLRRLHGSHIHNEGCAPQRECSCGPIVCPERGVHEKHAHNGSGGRLNDCGQQEHPLRDAHPSLWV